MVDWAAENARLSGLGDGKVRWIVDDVLKFVRREVKRGRKYDGFILDPPSFGRGAKGEVWKIERDLPELMELMMAMCGGSPAFIVLSCFTLGFGPANLDRILRTYLPADAPGEFSSTELVIPESSGRVHPRGACAYYAAPGIS
jgi:23S rRNA (cytosine1962-C5)-methyltransferase